MKNNWFAFALFLCMLLLFSGAVFSSTITRQLPAYVTPGQTFTVSLVVSLTNSDDHYSIEEIFPSQFLASNLSDDGGISGGAARWAVIQGATSTTLTYQLIAPQEKATYTFSGTYYASHQGSPNPKNTIAGPNSIIVKDAPAPPVNNCGNATCAADENCATCPDDCGSCPIINPLPFCGDNNCNGTETCSSCATDCGSCPPPVTCNSTNCVPSNECKVATCVNNVCTQTNKANNASCSKGWCQSGVCQFHDAIVDDPCTEELEGQCIIFDGIQGTCVGGTLVVGCSGPGGGGTTLDLLSNPLALQVIVGLVLLVIIVLVVIIVSGKGKNKKPPAEKELGKEFEIERIRNQLKEELRKK